MFAKAFVVGALAVLAAAQSTSVSFTKVPTPVQAGKQEVIEYKATEGSPVTILLRKGASTDLKTVATLTSSSTGGSYNWDVSSSLVDGSDYALQITQGSETNYYGPFSITGGSAAGSSSSSSASASGPAGYGSSSSSSASVTSSVSSSSASASIPATYPAGNTTITPVGTAPVSVGTGSPIGRNSTMSRATLSGTASASATGGSATGGAGFQGSQTGSASVPTSTGGASALMTTGGSVVALLFGAVAAVLFA